MRDGLTGEAKWEFNDFLRPIDGFLETGFIFGAHDKTIVHYWHRTYCIDNYTGALTWATDVSDRGAGAPAANILADYIYTVNYWGGKPKSTSESMVRTHYLSGQWDTLFTLNAKGDHYYLNVYPPTLWIKPDGDSVLIVRNNEALDLSQAPGQKHGRASLYAFNVRTRAFEWAKEDFEPGGAVAWTQPLVDGNRLYVLGRKDVYCIDLTDGHTLWVEHFPAGVLQSSVVGHGDKVIVQSDDIGMWGLDKQTGARRWYNGDTDGAAGVLTCFDGIVYFTSSGYGRLYAIDAETGETIWKERSPNRTPRTPYASFSIGGLAIDTTNRTLFVADTYYLMCIELPR